MQKWYIPRAPPASPFAKQTLSSRHAWQHYMFVCSAPPLFVSFFPCSAVAAALWSTYFQRAANSQNEAHGFVLQFAPFAECLRWQQKVGCAFRLPQAHCHSGKCHWIEGGDFLVASNSRLNLQLFFYLLTLWFLWALLSFSISWTCSNWYPRLCAFFFFPHCHQVPYVS